MIVIITALNVGAEEFNLLAARKGKPVVSSHWPCSTIAKVILWCTCCSFWGTRMQWGTRCHQRFIPALFTIRPVLSSALQSIPTFLVAVDTSLPWRFSLAPRPACQDCSTCPSWLVTLPSPYSGWCRSPLNLTDTTPLCQGHSPEYQSHETVCAPGFCDQMSLGNIANIVSWRLVETILTPDNIHKTY